MHYIKCACGCGQTVKPGRTFLRWHHLRNCSRRILPLLRECADCGAQFKPLSSDHRFCSKTCAGNAKRVSRQTFTCVGYLDYGVVRHAKRCRQTLELAPNEIRARQKGIEKWTNSPWRSIRNMELKSKRQPAFIDESRAILRCGFCSMGSMTVRSLDSQLRNKLGDLIRSPKDRREALAAGYKYLSPNWSPSLGPGGNDGPLALEHRRRIAKSNIVRKWTVRPMAIRVAICEGCEMLTISQRLRTSGRWHGSCWRDWKRSPAGRRWLVAPGDRREQLPRRRRRGRPYDEANLLRDFQWAILHYLGGQSFREIGAREGLAHKNVIKAVRSICSLLPDPDHVPRRYRVHVEALQAAKSVQPTQLAR
jgi:hypothetical protein